MPQYNYSESTARQIANYIRHNPGSKGREIASALGLKKEHVNSWLYTPWVQKKYKVQVKNYSWYDQEVQLSRVLDKTNHPAPQSKTQVSSRPSYAVPQNTFESRRRKSVSEWKKHIETYTTEQIRKTFDNPQYDSMPDEFKVALWEVKQEREKLEKTTNAQPIVDTWKQEVKKYSPDAVSKAFASNNYDQLTDDQKAALVEVLEENKHVQTTTAQSGSSKLAKKTNTRTIIVAGGVVLGFLLLYHLLLPRPINRIPSPQPDNQQQTER